MYVVLHLLFLAMLATWGETIFEETFLCMSKYVYFHEYLFDLCTTILLMFQKYLMKKSRAVKESRV